MACMYACQCVGTHVRVCLRWGTTAGATACTEGKVLAWAPACSAFLSFAFGRRSERACASVWATLDERPAEFEKRLH